MNPQSDLLRRSGAFTLASLAVAYPNPELMGVLNGLGPDLATWPSLGPIALAVNQDLDGLRSAYLSLFETAKDRAPLYETEYGRMRGLSKGKDLADVVGFYHAFGFEMRSDLPSEAPDHLAIELEFLALLLYKQHLLADDPEGVEIVNNARRTFLQEHLGAFGQTIARRPSVAADPIYGPLLAWVGQLIAEECGREELVPAPLDFFEAEDAAGGVECGGCVQIPGLRGRL
jgi:nitrate reductase assembly molybdenum cofactor insertion protein NarJ